MLSVAAALSIAQAVVKVAEMLLDSFQQQVFQASVDKLALRLIDLNPIRHYRRMSERKVQISWLVLSVLIMWGTTGIVARGSRGIHERGGWLAYGLALPILMYFPFRWVVSWLAKSATAGRMLLKAWGIVFVLSTSVYLLLKTDLFYNADDNLRLLVLLPFGFVSAVFFYAGFAVVVIYAAQGAVWFFRQVFWRIATYTKGAWSAVMLLVAGILGVAAAIVARH